MVKRIDNNYYPSSGNEKIKKKKTFAQAAHCHISYRNLSLHIHPSFANLFQL